MNRYLTIENASRFLLTWLMLAVAAGLATYFQTEYQLNSPFIPQTIAENISRPYLLSSLVCICIAIIVVWLHFFKKYNLVIIICSITILWRSWYINWGAW